MGKKDLPKFKGQLKFLSISECLLFKNPEARISLNFSSDSGKESDKDIWIIKL